MMSLRTAGVLVATVALAMVAVLGLAVGRKSTEATAQTEIVSSDSTALVEVADLVETVEVDGTMTSLVSRSVVKDGPGVITALPNVGDRLRSGEVIYEVDEAPVVFVGGETPAWRSLAVDSIGADVAQLERALVELGYDTADQLSVDDVYTSYTAELVGLWQADLGLEATGRVPFGSVVFAPVDELGEALVSLVTASIGDEAAGVELLTLATSARLVVAEIGTVQAQSLAPQSPLSIELADRSTLTATIASIDSIGGGRWRLTAIPTHSADGGELPPAELPVVIGWIDMAAEQVLAVPAQALLRHDDGTYTVDVLRLSTVERVEVVPGAAADRLVAITGGVAEGDEVIVP